MIKLDRAEREVAHGKKLSALGAEKIWGWGTPAGQVRAKRRAEIIIATTKMIPGKKTLEIGCGTGIFTEYFAQTGATITAVDISDDLLSSAKARKLPSTVRFILSRFEDLASDEQFDIVVGSSVLHHLDIEPALINIFRLLKPGGVISFGEPNMLNPQIMLQKNISWIKELVGDSPDETAFFRWQIKSLLQKVGFTNISITPLTWLHPLTPPSLIPSILKIDQILEKVPLIKEFAGSLYISAQKPYKE